MVPFPTSHAQLKATESDSPPPPPPQKKNGSVERTSKNQSKDFHGSNGLMLKGTGSPIDSGHTCVKCPAMAFHENHMSHKESE